MDKGRELDIDGFEWANSPGGDDKDNDSEETGEDTNELDEETPPTQSTKPADPTPPQSERETVSRPPEPENPVPSQRGEPDKSRADPDKPAENRKVANEDDTDPLTNLIAEKVEENKQLREELAARDERIDRLEGELESAREKSDQLVEKVEAARKETQSFKERSKKRETQARQDGIRNIVTSMTKVRDTLQRALEQDKDVDVREGLESTLSHFDKALEEYGVMLIYPEVGDEVDPSRHEVIQKLPSDTAEGEIIETYSVGYENEDGVIKTASVIISAGPEEQTEE